MNKQTRMILFAALLSASLFGISEYWYDQQGAQKEQHIGVKPVAFTAAVRADVQRRPASRLIWQHVSSGEPLYPGESIKTSSKSEVRIQFAEGNRYIDLEPESLVVISSNSNEISLDLMDGSLFVAGGDNSGPSLTLNSAQGKVDLSRATASLSKSGKGVDVQVLTGQATNANGQEIKNLNEDSIKIISPRSDQTTIINPDNAELVKFQWQGLPEKSLVAIWLGPSRNELKLIAQTTIPGLSQVEKRLPVGKHFFKLVASDPAAPDVKVESKLHRFEVMARFAPAAVYPTQDSTLLMNKASNPVVFKWSKPVETKNTFVEIAKDGAFTQILKSQNFNEEESFTFSLPLGDYFWRLSTKYEGSEKSVVSKPIHFSINDRPKNQMHITWSPNQNKETQLFIGQPSLTMNWKLDGKAEVKKWKLHLWPEKEGRMPSSETEKVIETTSATAKSDVPQAGLFNAQVEAYNENGVLIASSEPKTFEAAPRPLLRVPLFLPETGDLQANNRGNLDLKWTKLDEAKTYELVLLDSNGKELRRAKFNKSSTSLVNLMPGQYQVDIFATDIYGRESLHGVPRHVTVPDTSDLMAPKLKKVQVN